MVGMHTNRSPLFCAAPVRGGQLESVDCIGRNYGEAETDELAPAIRAKHLPGQHGNFTFRSFEQDVTQTGKVL